MTIDAFIHDQEFGIEAEELESHLVVAGKYLMVPLYLAVFDESRSLRSRRWVCDPFSEIFMIGLLMPIPMMDILGNRLDSCSLLY